MIIYQPQSHNRRSGLSLHYPVLQNPPAIVLKSPRRMLHTRSILEEAVYLFTTRYYKIRRPRYRSTVSGLFCVMSNLKKRGKRMNFRLPYFLNNIIKWLVYETIICFRRGQVSDRGVQKHMRRNQVSQQARVCVMYHPIYRHKAVCQTPLLPHWVRSF